MVRWGRSRCLCKEWSPKPASCLCACVPPGKGVTSSRECACPPLARIVGSALVPHPMQWCITSFITVASRLASPASADNACLIALPGVTLPTFWSLTLPLPSGCRVCEINSVDNSVISTFAVHEFEGANRLGSRSRRYIITGHSNGNVQVSTEHTRTDIRTHMHQHM